MITPVPAAKKRAWGFFLNVDPSKKAMLAIPKDAIITPKKDNKDNTSLANMIAPTATSTGAIPRLIGYT